MKSSTEKFVELSATSCACATAGEKSAISCSPSDTSEEELLSAGADTEAGAGVAVGSGVGVGVGAGAGAALSALLVEASVCAAGAGFSSLDVASVDEVNGVALGNSTTGVVVASAGMTICGSGAAGSATGFASGWVSDGASPKNGMNHRNVTCTETGGFVRGFTGKYPQKICAETGASRKAELSVV